MDSIKQMPLTLVLQVTAIGMPLRSPDHHLITWQFACICDHRMHFNNSIPLTPAPSLSSVPLSTFHHSADFWSVLAPAADEVCPAWHKCLYVKLGIWELVDILTACTWRDLSRLWDSWDWCWSHLTSWCWIFQFAF